MTRIIDFSPPMVGIDGEFNTFRLGRAWAKRIQPGDRVILMDKKEFALMGWAEIVAVEVGKLDALSALHAGHNHNQKHLDPAGASDRLIAAMIKRYGPNMCRDTSIVTMISMKRTE